jgi:hypothetical protein
MVPYVRVTNSALTLSTRVLGHRSEDADVTEAAQESAQGPETYFHNLCLIVSLLKPDKEAIRSHTPLPSVLLFGRWSWSASFRSTPIQQRGADDYERHYLILESGLAAT